MGAIPRRWKAATGAFLLTVSIGCGIAEIALADAPSYGSEELQRLLGDPSFVDKVARRNGLSPARFYGQEAGRMHQMARAYLEEKAHQKEGSASMNFSDHSPAERIEKPTKYSAAMVNQLLADPSFAEKVARHNGMNSVRFYGQGGDRIHQMTRAYLKEQEARQEENSTSAFLPSRIER